MTDDKDKDPVVPGTNKPESGASGRSGFGKAAIAVIVVLLVIVAGLATLNFVSLTSQGSSSKVVAAASTAVINQPYNLSVNVNGKFSNMTMHFGDGTVTTVAYTGSTNITVSHLYKNPGDYYVYFTVNFGSTVFQGSGTLVRVIASNTNPNQYSSLGLISLIPGQSSNPLVNQTTIFSPGAHASFLLGYFTSPVNGSYQVIGQTLSVYRNGSLVTQVPLSYAFNSSSGTYNLPVSSTTYNMSGIQEGYYELKMSTYTAQVNSTTGVIYSSAGIYSTSYYLDMPVFSNGALFKPASSKSVFVEASITPGGYTSLDPAVAYDLLGTAVIANTLQDLVTTNMTSPPNVLPALTSALPSVQNGGINNNYANYTQTYTNMAGQKVTYAVNLTPYENFTYHIRDNASWQDGTPVTAWDMMYSITRTLLFDGGSPGTPGWILAQYMLPGDIFSSNTFYNITQNMTVNNATNNITFHFQESMSAPLVNELFAAPGAASSSAKWFEEHGAGITWTPAGFQAYQSEAQSNNYVHYVQNNIFSDGPYMISYVIPGSQVVLVANPYFTAPGPWYPAPKIDVIIINYIDEISTGYIAMKSGQAQGTSIPTSNWNDVISLNNSGAARPYAYPSLGLYFYNFNANVNTTILSGLMSDANMPNNLFTALSIRKAFAYGFNYQYYLDYQVGNKIYNTTFAQTFGGALPQGMLYAQTVAELNASGATVPYFNPTIAKEYWNAFLNSTANSVFGITETGGVAYYNSKPLVVPIFLFPGDPADAAGAVTWASDMMNITGIKLQTLTMPFNQLNALGAQPENPMALSIGIWFPDYPYPTDYLEPIALPSNNSAFLGSADFTPYWIYGNSSNSAQNQTEAMQLQSLVNDYNNGASAVTADQTKYWFQKMNEEFVNLTFIVPLQQQYTYVEISSKINPAAMTPWEVNVMLYQYLSYT